MSQGPILHLFPWDRKFLLPFREFIHENFADGRHRFIIYGDVVPNDVPASPDTVVYPSLLKNVLVLSKIFYQAEKIILHGLFNNRLIYILACQPWILEKCYWVMWGGDLYVRESDKKDWRWKKNEFFRSMVIKRLGNFVTYIDGDYELAKKWYRASGIYHNCIMYPSNVYNAPAVKQKQDSTTIIQVGNSANPSNNHLEVLERLLPYRDDKIFIYVPLSYGNDEYAELVITEGTKMFGTRFIPLTSFMTLNRYLEFLGQVDIAIFNHDRQQAMGNAITLLGLGKKVYMRREVTPWSLLSALGVTIFDVKDIDLKPLGSNRAAVNKRIIADHFTEVKLKEQYSELFG